jgi:hypothetical protein
MKKTLLVSIIILLFLSGAVFYSKQNKATISDLSYYLVSDQKKPGAIEIEGCSLEYLIPVQVPEATEVSAKLALEYLLAIKTPIEPVSGLSTSLYNSELTFDIIEEDDTVSLNLVGDLISAGTCDVPRITGQIESTLQNYYPSKQIQIGLNGSLKSWECFGDESGNCQ